MKTIKPGVWIARDDVLELGEDNYHLFRKRLKESGYPVNNGFGDYSRVARSIFTDCITLTINGDLVWVDPTLNGFRVKSTNRLYVNDVLEYIARANINRKLVHSHIVVAGARCQFVSSSNKESDLAQVNDRLEKETNKPAKVYNVETGKLVTVTSTHKFTLL